MARKDQAYSSPDAEPDLADALGPSSASAQYEARARKSDVDFLGTQVSEWS